MNRNNAKKTLSIKWEVANHKDRNNRPNISYILKVYMPRIVW